MPVGSFMKNNTPRAGTVTAGVHYEYEFLGSARYEGRTIPNINRERTDNHSATLFVNYGMTDRLGITALIPFRSITNEKVLFRGQYDNQYEGGGYIRHAQGVADILLMTNIALTPAEEPYVVVLSGGIKFANAGIDAVDVYDQRIDDNLQIGSGSVDPVVSLFASLDRSQFSFSTGLLGRISTRENIYGYKYGNEFNATLSIDFQGWQVFFVGVQGRYAYTTRDHYEYGKISSSRGGTWITGGPHLGVRFSTNFDLEFALPLALYQHVNESQLVSDYQIQVTTKYRF